MQRLRCNSCAGEYQDVDAGGSTYFHVCPPEIITTHFSTDAQGKITAAEVRAPQPNPRNENIVAGDEPGTVRIKAQGSGVTNL